jgi:hypothetical protein
MLEFFVVTVFWHFFHLTFYLFVRYPGQAVVGIDAASSGNDDGIEFLTGWFFEQRHERDEDWDKSDCTNSVYDGKFWNDMVHCSGFFVF